MLLTAGCGGGGDTVGTVEIVSGHNTYEPLINWAGMFANGLSGPNTAIRPQDAAHEIPSVIYQDDFDVVITGGRPWSGGVRYTIYNSRFQQISSEMDAFEIPGQPGEYYMEIFVTWTNNDDLTNRNRKTDEVQYFVKVIVQ